MVMRAVGNQLNSHLVVAQSNTAVTRSSDGATDTVYATLATATLPGGLMGANGSIHIESSWNMTNSANSKIIVMQFGGTIVFGPPLTTVDSHTASRVVQNLGATNSQHCLNVSGYGSGTVTSTTVDTENDVDIIFKCKWGANIGSEFITLVSYRVTHIPGV